MSSISKEILETQLTGIVGTNFTSDSKVLEKYSQDQSFVPQRKPLYVVRPQETEQVQQIIKLANGHRLPIVPYSSGTNNQGAAIPSYGGVLLDLSRMNKIIEIDPEIRVATIEPGVTFAQLQEEAEKHDLRVCTPLELPSSASVISTYLSLAPLYSWPRYGTEFLLAMKIVLPTGQKLNTGSANYPAVDKPCDPFNVVSSFLNRVWLGAQGTLGVVTWSTIKLKTLHEVNKIFFIPFEKIEDAFKPIREIKRARIGEELFVMNKMDLGLILAERFPEGVIEMREVLPQETLIIALRGPKEEVEYQVKDLEEIASDLKFELKTDLPRVKNAAAKILEEIRSPRGYEKTSCYKGARNTIPFIATIERIPEYDKIIYELATRYGYPVEDVGKILSPVEIGRVYCQYSFQRDPKDPEDSRRVRKLFYEAGDHLMRKKAFFAWPYEPWAELVYNRAEKYHLLTEKFKKIVDPNNIMNPGKLAL